MLRPTSQRPLLAFFDSIKALRYRQLSLILKAGYDPNLMLNGRGQNGLQFMVQYFAASEAHMMRLEIPAARSAYLNMAKLLLDAGLDPNATDLLTGESVIYDAIKLQDRDLVALLLHYVDLSLRNKDGETALMCAARFANKQIMRLMLVHLHDLELDEFYLRQRNRFGLTALDLARAENLECAKMLAKHLITLGLPTGGLLTRSSSHHQLNHLTRQALMGRPLVAGAGPAVSSRSAHHARALAAGYALNEPLVMSSDCESVVDAYGYSHSTRGVIPTGSRSSRRHLMPAFNSDHRSAAEFNRFLMSNRNEGQSSSGLAPWQSIGPGGGTGSTTDDDEEIANNSDLANYGGQPTGAYGGAGAGPMTRSRSSCNLGPTSGGALDKKLDGAGPGGASGGGGGSMGGAGKYGQSATGSKKPK